MEAQSSPKSLTTTEEVARLLPSSLSLIQTKHGLSLVGDGMELYADLTTVIPRLSSRRLSQELLVRAAKIKHAKTPPFVVDATAGFGEDSLLLAAFGYTVSLYEHNPVIAALLRDALVRAAQNETLSPIVSRMTLYETDSIQALHTMKARPDVVYLDPMFPQRTKSAAVKKKFQLIHQIEWPCSDEKDLFEAAYSCHPRKIVIKRALKGPYLANQKPHYSLKGKAVRYDCFAFAAIDS